MRTAFRLVICYVCVSFVACAAQAREDDAARWKITKSHTGGRPDNPWVVRNRKDPRFVFVEPGTGRGDLLRALQENPCKQVISTDGRGSMTTYNLTDMKWADDIREWRVNGCREYLIEPPIDGYQKSSDFAGTLVVEGGASWLPFGATRASHHELVKPDRGKCRAFVYIGAPTTDGDAFFHELLRSHVRSGPRIGRRHGSLAIESKFWEDGFQTVHWVSDSLIISVYGQTKIDEVVQAYLKKYPSTLPHDFRFDAVAWGHWEYSLRVAEMRERISQPDESLLYKPPPTFERALNILTQTFNIVELKSNHSREQRRLREQLIAGTEWRQDYEGYERELIALRHRTLEAIVKLYEGKELRFSRSKRQFVPVEDALGIGFNAGTITVGALVCAGAAIAAVTHAWCRKRL